MTEISPITRSTNGATFVKTDLHVHTPGSYDVDEDICPEEFVGAIIAKDIELIAITDHDCQGWYQEIRDAATDTDLEVLPGVEITTSQGAKRRVHMTAIFPPENANKVNYVLNNIGIDPVEAGNTQASESIWEICNRIKDNDGLPILAHIDKKAGADFEFDRNNPIKEDIFDEQKVAALEITKRETCDRDVFSEFALITSSDAHQSDQIGSRTTYMKMAEPSFEGLQMALRDPESRISLDESHSNQAAVTGIRCKGEFFENKELQLNKGLNCLIGGKGTGKSTVVEQIRYALDIPPRVGRIKDEYEELVEATLGEDGMVEIHLSTNKGQTYSVRREFGCEPVIHRLDGTQVPLSIEQFKGLC
ncbi:AAA family ATPase [Halococcus salifodinae]|uniref:Phosphoesterase PHP domain-containing protein n=1 Tax=Halococcus salifodinae DSM 8989 TaxID=1227456 RepID=M0MZ23_9EURY|nr:AAA family ATPase [Halococcus salifodinae]EMA50972.1 phosphoesterase PHP domain-containing protein [Halococcus salifodinae DSM 8989]